MKEFLSHLSNNTSGRAMKMRDEIADISWELTGSELIALIRESIEIKSLQPLYNRAQRRLNNRWGICHGIDDKGYIVFSISRVKESRPFLATFNSKESVKTALERLIEKYSLCQKLAGMYETEGACFHYQLGICRGACCGKESPQEYNRRASKAMDEFIFTPGTISLLTEAGMIMKEVL